VNGAGRRGRRQDLPIKAEINVTSLVDVAFTLLVIFIIIAPALQGGVEVEVPTADVTPLTTDEDAFYVTVDRDNLIYLAGTEVALENIESCGQLGTGPQSDRHGRPVGGDQVWPGGRTPHPPMTPVESFWGGAGWYPGGGLLAHDVSSAGVGWEA
jgi:hypothetical protein